LKCPAGCEKPTHQVPTAYFNLTSFAIIQNRKMQQDFPAFEIIPGDFTKGMLLICDHASSRLPPGYGSLGLPAEEFKRHIAYDIGAEGLTRGLAEKLGLSLIHI